MWSRERSRTVSYTHLDVYKRQLAGRPGTHAYIREMNERIFSKYHVMTVGEVAAATSLELMNYVRTARREFDMAIPFVPPKVEISTWSPGKLKRDLRESYEALRDSGWWARFFSNHDKPRQVSLYGDDGRCWEVSAKLLAMLLHTLPGTPFLYQGEEIGMTNVRFPSIELYDDPDAKNCYRQMLLEGASEEEALRQAQLESRDNARTPMQWDSSPQAGFTAGTPWLPVNPNYKTINVEAQRNDPYSILQCYRRLLSLRRENPVLARGDLEFFDLPEESLLGDVYKRQVYRSGKYKLSFSMEMNRYLNAHQQDFMQEDTSIKVRLSIKSLHKPISTGELSLTIHLRNIQSAV